MRVLKWILAIAMGGSVAGVVYGWGIGWLLPCGPVDRVIQVSQCRVLASFDSTQLETLLLDGDGSLLTVTRGDGPEPRTPQQLVGVSTTDGSITPQAELGDLPPGSSWMNASLSADGARIGASLLDQPAMILDRHTGKKLLELPLFSVAAVGFGGDGEILVDRGLGSSERPPEAVAQVFSASDGTPLPDLAGEPALGLFSSGISRALSADGTTMAQHVETREDTGIVALRLADAAFPAWSGGLVTAPLGGWSDQILPRLWFSPDSKFVAAAFDSAPVWGRDTSALLIWDMESKALVQRIPTHSADWDSLVWLDKRQVAVTRFNTVTRRGEIAVIGY